MIFFLLDCTCNVLPTTSPHLEFKDYVALIAPALLILTFTIDRVIASSYRKKEFLRTWFYKTLLEPNFEKIEEFYKESLTIFSKNYRKLKAAQPADVNKLKSKINAEFQDLKRTFEFEVLELVKWSIPSLNDSLLNSILDLEDEFVNKIENFQSPNNLEQEFRSYLMLHKAQLYISLHEALKHPQTSRRNRSQVQPDSGFNIRNCWNNFRASLREYFSKHREA
ncbi:MAG: hypothetical protein JWQ09_5111 [Segetibacter sp.]|nr:hypothetical protein [Segetibacter sp.]